MSRKIKHSESQCSLVASSQNYAAAKAAAAAAAALANRFSVGLHKDTRTHTHAYTRPHIQTYMHILFQCVKIED